MSALAARAPSPHGIAAELAARQPLLAWYGFALLALSLVTAALQLIDPRLLASGVPVWTKPTKFFFSIGLFALTAGWFFGYVRLERRRAPPMQTTTALIVGAGSFELSYISLQAALGLESHFNIGTPFHAIMYGLMGLGAVLLTGAVLPLAWEIARRPAPGLPPDYVAAVVIGLLLTFLLGGMLGGYMSAQLGHSVGAEGGHVPVFGWNRSGGDYRIAHFLGIHAEQAIPLLAASVAGLAPPARWRIVLAGSALYTGLILAVFAQALAGRPLLPL